MIPRPRYTASVAVLDFFRGLSSWAIASFSVLNNTELRLSRQAVVTVLWMDGPKYNSSTLTQVLKGVKRLRPGLRDKRAAFLLPHYNIPLRFVAPKSKADLILLVDISFGFFAMLRFHTYGRLSVSALVLVDRSGFGFSCTSREGSPKMVMNTAPGIVAG